MHRCVLYLIVRADELEGLHAELELSLVGGGVDFNSLIHVTPGQSRTQEKDKTQNLCQSAPFSSRRDRSVSCFRHSHDEEKKIMQKNK